MPCLIKLVLIVVFLILVAIYEAVARPGILEEYWNSEDKCKTGVDEVIETCQICAKQTKSPIVYPMCCVNEEDVYNWCSRFINFGQHLQQ
ncbi:uncharacterized protein LOC123322758 [Coccinella septempunctata]|uniref:uncharacterized protein LOC123322758 n=1 Tax=Coccinella septempunctata TaxID=41139 RepID=UPI001D06244D|nr:uncharacterized protein LOC123322758 [Coccinella septempunctata]